MCQRVNRQSQLTRLPYALATQYILDGTTGRFYHIPPRLYLSTPFCKGGCLSWPMSHLASKLASLKLSVSELDEGVVKNLHGIIVLAGNFGSSCTRLSGCDEYFFWRIGKCFRAKKTKLIAVSTLLSE